jgi:hypothetical protein
MDGEGRTSQDDSMNGIGRVESGAKTEQLPRMAEATARRDCFGPSLAQPQWAAFG